jgi:dolichol-phosphate mannosyltransferase
MKTIVVVPTYNERENLENFVNSVRAQPGNLDILVVDDNSPDHTGDLADQLASRFSGKVFVLHRKCKEGLGPAYLAGFQHVLAHMDHDLIIQMDADLSHDPAFLPAFVKAAETYDLVLGSRYIRGISVVNWDFKRLLLSKTASRYVRMVTGLPFTDLTGGFKCWRRQTLEGINLNKVSARGYIFQTEMTYRAHRMGFRVGEIPIIFYERNLGRSKISGPIIIEALFRVGLLRFKRLGRSGMSQPGPSSANPPASQPSDLSGTASESARAIRYQSPGRPT